MKTDAELQHDVLEQLKWEPSVNAAHIGVSAKDGVVTLMGHVPSYAEKLGAERAAKHVYGVMAVADELDVRLPGSTKRADDDIAAACVHALKAHGSVPDEQIKILVGNGWVTLEGQVEWQYQKEAAENAIRHLVGVCGVSNSLLVKTPLRPTDVKRQIEAAFRRSAEVDARRISVEVHDGRVILRGRVRSWSERDEAQQAVWAAPGVTTVENDLTVTP